MSAPEPAEYGTSDRRTDGNLPLVTEKSIPIRNMALQYNFVFDRAGGSAQLNNLSWPQWVSTITPPKAGELANGTYRPLLAPVNFNQSKPGTKYFTVWYAGPLSIHNRRGSLQFIPSNLQQFTAAGGRNLAPPIDRRQRMASHQTDEVIRPGEEEWAGGDKKRAGSLFGPTLQTAASMSRSLLAPATTRPLPDRACCALCLGGEGLGPRHAWVHKHPHDGRLWDQLAQEPELLRPLRTQTDWSRR